MENTSINEWKDIFLKGGATDNLHKYDLLEIRY